jgi:putative FmdB family regulatory protein
MPLFEYTCRGCGHRFETLVTASRQAACPSCRSTDLEKLFSTFAARGTSTRANAGGATPRFT